MIRGAGMAFFSFLFSPESRAKPAGPRPTSPREGAFAVLPAEHEQEWLRHKVPKTQAAAPTRGRARPYVFVSPVRAESKKRLQPGDRTAQNQRMHIVGAFIGVHGFQVHHVAHDLVIFLNAISAVHVA